MKQDDVVCGYCGKKNVFGIKKLFKGIEIN